MGDLKEKTESLKRFKNLSRKEKIIEVLSAIGIGALAIVMIIYYGPQIWQYATATDLPRDREFGRTILFIVLGGLAALFVLAGIIWLLVSDNKFLIVIRWLLFISLAFWGANTLAEKHGWAVVLSGASLVFVVDIFFRLKAIDNRLARMEMNMQSHLKPTDYELDDLE